MENTHTFAIESGGGLLESALTYATAIGWKVIPLHTPNETGGCSCRKADCKAVGKHPRTMNGLKDATTDPETIERWWGMWPEANIGIATGSESGVFVLDIDPRHGGDKSLKEMQERFGRLPATLTGKTGGDGLHIIFEHPGGRIKNLQGMPDRFALFGAGIDVKGDGGYIVAAPSLHTSGKRYEWESLDEVINDAPRWLVDALTNGIKKSPVTAGESAVSWEKPVMETTIREGSRNSELTSLAGSMRNRGMGEEEILAALTVTNRSRVVPPVSEDEIVAIVRSVLRYAPQDNSRIYIGENTVHRIEPTNKRSTPEFPMPNEKMFHGLAGEFVRLIQPHTEADPVGILIQFLVIFGNIIGRSAHFQVEADRQHLNLFTVLVGKTAGGRKETSLGQAMRLFDQIDNDWKARCVVQGLSSGEGLVKAVRDPVEEMKPVKKGSSELEFVITDVGVTDKRLLVCESEFASVLAVQRREGNTLSTMIRQAWDIGNLRVMTKHDAYSATNAHISIIGHITKEELQRSLNQNESFNGYVNRFLWVCVQRANVLPEGGNASDLNLDRLNRSLSVAVDFAKGVGEMKRNEEARALWRRVYPRLSDGHGGLIGAVTARGAAQVIRLACIYALLDCCEEVRLRHLTAALALWQYCEASARYAFGEQTGNRDSDQILSALRAASSGLTRTEISGLFGRNLPAGRLQAALDVLHELNMAKCHTETVEGSNRRAERWFADTWQPDFLNVDEGSDEKDEADSSLSCNSYFVSHGSSESARDEFLI